MKADWNLVELRRVLYQDKESAESVQPDQEYPMVGVYSFGRGLFAKESQLGMNTSYKVFFRLKENHIVMSQLFGWEGALALSSKEFEGKYVSNQFPTFLVDETKADRQFIGFYLKRQMVWEMLFERGKGMGSRRRTLKPESLLGLKMPLPPLSEQRRISERLQGLQGKIEAVRRLRGEQVKAVVDLYYNHLTEIRNDYLATYGFERLGDITKITSGGTPSRDNYAFWDGGIPFIKTGELKDGEIMDAEEHITEEALKNSSAKLFPKDTILIALYGQGQTRGRTGRLMIEAATNQACCAILPCPKLVPVYTQLWLQSLYVEMRENAFGSGQPNWNGGTIKNVRIATPPKNIQLDFIQKVQSFQSQIDALKTAQDVQLLELVGLFPGVLEKVFRGQV